MIKAYIITLPAHGPSNLGYEACVKSIEETKSDITPIRFRATTPDLITHDMQQLFGEGKVVPFTWPIIPEEKEWDIRFQFVKRAYKTTDWRKKYACSISHMRLWKECADSDETIMILEHDAIFMRQFKEEFLKEFTGGACGLNSPLGATRKANIFYKKLLEMPQYGCYPVPTVNDVKDMPCPQGLAGNSAYLIKPYAARELLDFTKKYGVWPNDAVMCRELFPWLQVSKPYFTGLQGISSTTVG
jgi:GR25 family glycosyltransferase involved in LPS biosynthesis